MLNDINSSSEDSSKFETYEAEIKSYFFIFRTLSSGLRFFIMSLKSFTFLLRVLRLFLYLNTVFFLFGKRLLSYLVFNFSSPSLGYSLSCYSFYSSYLETVQVLEGYSTVYFLGFLFFRFLSIPVHKRHLHASPHWKQTQQPLT